MKQSDKSISNQLEWTQQELDAMTALQPATRDQLAEQERKLREQKASLEKHIVKN